MGDRSARRGRATGALPLVWLALAALVTVVVLPSVLRPPPDQTQSSAALSPDAPPEDDAETIIQSLQQAASRTAGAAGTVETVPPTTVPVVERPSRGRCFGNPPRQVESLYAAPCRAAFVGDNGGSTYKNVDPDEIRVGMWHGLVEEQEGPIEGAPPAGEGAPHRTLRVLQEYFNANYELYGRRLQLVWLRPESVDDVGHRATAVRADQEHHVFASVYLAAPFCDEMARRGLITFCDNLTGDFYEPRAPYVWSQMPDLGKTDRLGAEYACKKLIGRPAVHAGDAAMHGQERRIGLLVEADPTVSGERSSEDIARHLREQCGYEPATTIDFQVNEGSAATLATAISRMRNDGVTTAWLSVRGGAVTVLMALAESQGWFPEWFQAGQYAIDWNAFAQQFPTAQSAHLFGLGVHEIARPLDDTDCYRAYRTIDPANTPDRTTCLLLFHDLMSLVNGLQEAGPDLNPDTFRQGLFSIGQRLYPDEPSAMGGGFGPGDWTYIDSAAEIWFDPNAHDPEQGRPGAWRWVRNGRRYLPGEIPNEEALVFTDGITQPSEARP